MRLNKNFRNSPPKTRAGEGVQIPTLRSQYCAYQIYVSPVYVQSIHLHRYIHESETSCATPHRRQPPAVSNSPKPATRAHARRHVGRPSPVGCSRHGGVCVLWDSRSQPFFFSFIPPPPRKKPFAALV